MSVVLVYTAVFLFCFFSLSDWQSQDCTNQPTARTLSVWRDLQTHNASPVVVVHAGLFSCLHNPLNSDARYNTWITCACDLFKRVSNGGSRLIVKFKFIVVLRPQRPDGLLGTGSPGRTPRLSHSSRVLVYSLTGSTICTVCTEFDWENLKAATNQCPWCWPRSVVAELCFRDRALSPSLRSLLESIHKACRFELGLIWDSTESRGSRPRLEHTICSSLRLTWKCGQADFRIQVCSETLFSDRCDPDTYKIRAH